MGYLPIAQHKYECYTLAIINGRDLSTNTHLALRTALLLKVKYFGISISRILPKRSVDDDILEYVIILLFLELAKSVIEMNREEEARAVTHD